MLIKNKVMSLLINRLLSAVRLITVFFIAYISCISLVHAQSTIEVGTAMLPANTTASATTPTTFSTITFQNPFPTGVIPNVFPMNTTMGPDTGADPAESDPCTIRIRNITNTGFDAVCLEPVNENRNHVLIMMDYIAIVDGITTVPVNDTGDSVIFESACETVSAQQYSTNQCPSCIGTLGYDSVTFATGFTAAPALLTQMVTTNIATNTTIIGEPDFIDVAIESGSLDEDGFMVAIERMEAGVGAFPMGASEQICYLAVEREGCRDLNLSSFGGPASVEFNAVSGGNVDGFGNGATTGEGATFTPMCFDNAPIAVAKQTSRNGPDGGFLRRESVSAAEIILTYDEDQVSNEERNHTTEEVAVFAFGSAFTTPVTLNRAQITQRGRNTFFEWETAAEALHLGFNLWGEMNGEWVQLNKRFIVSSGLDKDSTTKYRQRIRLDREQFNAISQFGLSSVDNSGYEEFYGPFVVGEEYGELANTQAIDWTETRALFETSMSERGYVNVGGQWRKVSDRKRQRLDNRSLDLGEAYIEIPINQNGVHSLSYEQVVNLENIDATQWSDKLINKLALTLNGKAVPRDIISDDAFFNQGDRILFYGRLPEGKDSIYLNQYAYQLRLDRSNAINANQFDGRKDNDDQVFSTQGMVSQKISRINAHSAFLRGDDPWYDSQLIVTSNPSSKTFNFDLEQGINTQSEARLELSVYGGINFPGADPDHHVQVSLNGVLIEDAVFDGNIAYNIDAVLPANLLKNTANVLSVTLPADTGYFVDLIQIDEIVVSGFKPLIAGTSYRFNADKDSTGYALDSTNLSDEVEVYAHDRNGGLSKITPSLDALEQTIQFSALPLSGNALERLELGYSVGDAQSWLSPVNLQAKQNNQLHDDESDYLIVAHPSFIGEKLDEFVELKEQQGLKAKVLNWLDIVSTYGFGNDSPAALEEFLRVQSNLKTPEYVLLVGGHTYDYGNIISQDAVNFLPTHYQPLSIFNFAPSDNPYADLDGDNIPEFAIGRWPVRDNDDLATIVNKTKAWHHQRESSPYQEGLLLAQANDSRDLNYADQIEGRVAQPLSTIPEFDQLTRAYLPQIIESGESEPINAMREQVAQAVNDGVDLISFAGHGSNAAWGTQTIVNTDFVKSLNNQGRPPVVMPLACYTTNYESLNTNTLAHQWLFADVGDQEVNNNIGSVAIHGATVLGEYRENAIFAERYLNQVNASATIGEAIKKAKQQMATQNLMLNNWALLGDPALPLR